MPELITIELKQIRFHAFHGLYAEEKKAGNEFEVNLAVSYPPASGTITDLSDTINYTALYHLLKAEMQKPRHLLETFIMETAELIHSSFSKVKSIDISIAKLHVPVAGFTGSTVVRYQKEYND